MVHEIIVAFTLNKNCIKNVFFVNTKKNQLNFQAINLFIDSNT